MVAIACSKRSPVALCRLLRIPSPSGFVSVSALPGVAPRRCAATCRPGEPGDGQAVLRLGVVDAVPAREVGAGLQADVCPAAQHLGSELEGDLVARPGQQVDREERLAAHGVDVREGVGRRDPAPVVGVVDDRGEEVGGRDHGAPLGPSSMRTAAPSSPCSRPTMSSPTPAPPARPPGRSASTRSSSPGRHLAGTATAGGVLGQTDFRELGRHGARLGRDRKPDGAATSDGCPRVTAEAFLVW